jgi:hypothetical protein
MTQTLISLDHWPGLQEGTTGGKNYVLERRVCEKREGELVWLEGSVTGTAVTYVMVRIAITL